MVKLIIMNLHAERREDRCNLITKEEWAMAVKDFPDRARYDVANLAAHNWDVFRIGDRLLVSSAWSGGYWWQMDGSREKLSDKDYASLYPRTDKRYGQGGTRGLDGKQRLVSADREALDNFAGRAAIADGGVKND